jgi:sterol desaturase/sphingolipid hydroxylase (fatty acid hydroxylase superfamily)
MENHQFSLIPGLILIGLVILEAILRIKEGVENYSIIDSLYSIGFGFLGFSSNIFFKGVMLSTLINIYEFRIFHFNSNWYWCIVLFLISDFWHFLVHYLEHKYRFLWVIHSIHHSSKFFNLSTALRTPLTFASYRILYLAPLCFIGFDPILVLTVDLIILIYGFIIHTETIGKLGILEGILNTPSHHRVHHGLNDQYLDKNFGTVLIIWDKIFGTFEKEKEKPRYGLYGKSAEEKETFLSIFHEIFVLVKEIHSSGGEMKKLIRKTKQFQISFSTSFCSLKYLKSSKGVFNHLGIFFQYFNPNQLDSPK